MKQFVRLLYALTMLFAAAIAAPVWAQTVVMSAANGAQLLATPVPTATVLKMLDTGTLLEVLELSAAGYTRVRTVDNAEGWIASSAISEQNAVVPTATLPAASGETVTALSPTPAAGSIDQASATASPPPLILPSRPAATAVPTEQPTPVPADQETVTVVNAPTAAPAPAISDTVIAASGASTEARIDSLQKELAVMRETNRELGDLTARNWFITGAAVIMAGFFTGFVLAKLQRRKKSWIG